MQSTQRKCISVISVEELLQFPSRGESMKDIEPWDSLIGQGKRKEDTG